MRGGERSFKSDYGAVCVQFCFPAVVYIVPDIKALAGYASSPSSHPSRTLMAQNPKGKSARKTICDRPNFPVQKLSALEDIPPAHVPLYTTADITSRVACLEHINRGESFCSPPRSLALTNIPPVTHPRVPPCVCIE